MTAFREALIIFALIFISLCVFAAPTITNVTSATADGTYKTGDVITITVQFSEAVNISGGTPAISLNTDASATYIGGDQTNVTSIDFNYVVAAAQNTTDLDYSSTGALTLGGATIVSNADGNSAVLTLPVIGAAGSLAVNKEIKVDTAAPYCTISSPADGNYYNSTTIIGVTFTYTCTDATALGTVVGKIDGTTVASATALSTIVSTDKTYSITLDANDTLGNTTTQATRSFIYDNAAPSSGSISFSGWTSLDKPTLTISATHSGGTSGVTMAFSCNNSLWTSWISYAASYSDFNINNSTYGCSRNDWNKTIYVKFKDAAGNADSNTYSGTVLYDNVAPSTPDGISFSPNNGKVTVFWDALSADNNSGNNKVEIYMNGSRKVDTNYGNSGYDITGLTNGTAYIFKLRASDKAGNYSAFTSEFTLTPAAISASITIKKSGTSIIYIKKGDLLDVECEFTDDANNARIIYKSYSPTSSDTNLKTSTGLLTSLSENYTVPTNVSPDKYGFWCTADNAPSTSIAYVYLDDESPDVAWSDSNNTFSGIKRIITTASDDKSLDKVEFDFSGTIYASTKLGNSFYFDLNTLKFDNGSYTLKAAAYDTAGNKNEITKTVTLENASTTKQKAQKAIQTAEEKQLTADDLITYFKKESILIQTALLTKKTSADADLAAANGLLASNPDGALLKANNSITSYDDFIKALKVETTATKIYTVDQTSMNQTLKTLGFGDEVIAKAEALTQKAGIERKLKLIKVAGVDGKLQVKVEISISNDTNSTELKIIEIIPKEFTTSAKNIISDTNFIILKDDPIIQFDINLAKSAKAVISYGLGELDANTANFLIDQNVINKFTAPPVVFLSTDKIDIASGFNFGDPLLIGIIVLAVILIIIVALFVRFAHPGHGMGGEKTIVEHLTPEKEAEKPKWSAP